MKKHLYIILTILITGIVINSNAQQTLGKWVIPTLYFDLNKTNELTFTEAGITSTPLSLVYQPTPSDIINFSGGAYNENYDRQFHILGDQICYLVPQDPPTDWVDDRNLASDFQIINKPGSSNEYYAFYTHKLGYGDYHFGYKEIRIENGVLSIDPKIEILTGVIDKVGFYITPQENSPRYLYASSRINGGGQIAGLRKWEITSNGLIFDSFIITQSDIDEEGFEAYNLEHKSYTDGTAEINVFAWIHDVEDIDQNVEELTIVNNGIPVVHDLGKGRLGGIEFSKYENDMIYVSTADDGLIKINYNIDPIEITILSSDFQRTFLQTAPDGHIYGVSNNGHYLGKIYQYEQGGHLAGYFDDDFFEFDQYHVVSSTREFTVGVPHYILPENENVHNVMKPIVETTPTCPNVDEGTATITIEGGFPPYELELFLDGDPTPPLQATYSNHWKCTYLL